MATSRSTATSPRYTGPGRAAQCCLSTMRYQCNLSHRQCSRSRLKSPAGLSPSSRRHNSSHPYSPRSRERLQTLGRLRDRHLCDGHDLSRNRTPEMRVTGRTTSIQGSPQPSIARHPAAARRGPRVLPPFWDRGVRRAAIRWPWPDRLPWNPGMSLLANGVRATMCPVRAHLAKRGGARIATRARS